MTAWQTPKRSVPRSCHLATHASVSVRMSVNVSALRALMHRNGTCNFSLPDASNSVRYVMSDRFFLPHYSA